MTMESNEARERVLNTAEQLFHERGYNAVSMRDIAEALNMRQASLYYHVPDGKEQLFVEITERGLRRHRKGLDEIIARAEPRIEAQLEAASQWLVDHAPIKLLSMLETDMPAISRDGAAKLTRMAYESFFTPITNIFDAAIEKGEIRAIDPNQLAGHFLSMMDGISYVTTASFTPAPMSELAQEMIDILLNGLRTK
jgi:AcrR family transcriptional regulator